MLEQKRESDSVVLQMKEQYEKMLSEGKALNARFHVSHTENAALRKECMEFKSAKSELKAVHQSTRIVRPNGCARRRTGRGTPSPLLRHARKGPVLRSKQLATRLRPTRSECDPNA